MPPDVEPLATAHVGEMISMITVSHRKRTCL